MSIINAQLLPSQQIAIAGVIDPQSLSPGVLVTAWVAMVDFDNMLATIQIGTISATGTVDAKLQQATDSSGTGSKDIAGKAITQLLAADDDKQALINLNQSELDVDNDFTHVQLSITTAAAAALVAGVLVGVAPKYGPADLRNAASVAEIVT